MKFTSEDLLKAMGLKLKDKIYFCDGYYQRRTFTIKMVNGIEFEEVPMLVGNDIKLKLLNLLDHEYIIIQPKPKLTEDEKVILRNLSKELKFISRDSFQKGGNLNLFKDKPERNWVIIGGDGYWVDNRNHMPYYSLRNFNHLFQFIKWEDEPYPIEELLKE